MNREDDSRERENEVLRARLDKLSNALDAQQRDARKSPLPRRWLISENRLAPEKILRDV
jgi:hypothetical protein